MCGVFGFSQANELARKLAPMIAYEMENRGKDSWGGTDGVEVIKRVGPILDTFEFPENWEQAIFHTRAATVGKVSERNAHPFVCLGENHKVIGIHNGHVSNYDMLKTKYQRPWAEVDSEHIFQHLAERRDMEDLCGSGTIAWFEDEQPLIHLARWNFGSLECANLPDGSFVFASTREAISKACRWARVEPSWYQTFADCFEHVVTPKDGKDTPLVAREKMTLGESWRVRSGSGGNGNRSHYTVPFNTVNNSSGYEFDRAKFDRKCRRCTAMNIDSYICSKCVKLLREEFDKEMLTHAV